MNEHKIRLCGSDMNGKRIPAEILADLLAIFVAGSRAALRLKLEGKSTARGVDPGWLVKAAGFDFVGLSYGSTVIELDAPPLATNVPEKFAQQNLFEDYSNSAMDLFEDALSEAIEGRPDSDRFDEPLLDICQRFNTIFYAGVDRIEISTGTHRAIKIEKGSVEKISTLRKTIPAPYVVRVSGKMNTIRHTDRMFELVLDSGASVRGIASDLANIELPRYFGKNVIVSGTAYFHPSGSVQRIEANTIELFDGTTSLWAELPQPRSTKFDIRKAELQKHSSTDFASLFGTWCGDETDEQIREALK